MIQLNSKKLSIASTAHLKSVQTDINGKADFEHKVKAAILKWNGKTGSHAAKAAFKNIKEKLIEMCSGTTICVYCEHNEGTDIEHIYPKRLYPNKAFSWSNYVLACGNCNSRYKKDKFRIFNPRNGVIIEDITPTKDVYIKPANEDALFINQHKENPLDLLELDIINKQFIFIETHNVGTREYEKAKYTKELLGLNERADLVSQRKAAYKHYLSELRKYVAVSKAIDFTELIEALDGDIPINLTANFNSEILRSKKIIKESILKHSHPTVFKEMIKQRNVLPSTNALVLQAPEILNW